MTKLNLEVRRDYVSKKWCVGNWDESNYYNPLYLLPTGELRTWKENGSKNSGELNFETEELANEALNKYLQGEAQEKKKVSEMNYIRSDSGQYNGVYEGKAFVVGRDHVNYDKIVECFRSKDYTNFWELANPAKAVEKYVGENVVVEGDCVYYKGEEVKNSVVNKIFQFMEEKLPHEPLVKFLENLMQNPSMASRNELYDFLEHNCFPLTEDGCFLGYKGLRADYKDCHSGTFLNTPGSVIEMERRNVDDDRRRHCSYGFHVGTFNYANGFQQGKLVLVKVNPKDVVSVPNDGCEKCRVCRYEVLQDVEVQLNYPLASCNDGVYDEFEDDEDDFCTGCSSSYDECVCETF